MMLSEEDVQPMPMSEFIDDELCDPEDESIEESNFFDSVCAFCDNGGDILCCEGRCLRSFHATEEAGEESECVSLGFTNKEVKQLQNFFCENCEHKQHQCFTCGKLGSSDKSSGAEVFLCVNATCGHFYHPRCVSKMIHREDDSAAMELEKKIISGESFTCPIHKCFVCQKGENKEVSELQFAICRRCPTSYHRKCLPKDIVFDNSDDEDEEENEDITIRAWDDLLPNRILIYCLKHEIDEEIGTPIRDHIIFPGDEERRAAIQLKKRKQMKEVSAEKRILLSKKRSPTSEGFVSEKGLVQVKKPKIMERSGKLSSVLDSKRKAQSSDVIRKPFSESSNKTLFGDRLFSLLNKRAERTKLVKPVISDSEFSKSTSLLAATRKLSTELPPLDANTEKRLLSLMKDASSAVTLEDVMRRHPIPSTHGASKMAVDKTITMGKVEGAIEAVRTALKKLDDGGVLEDAKVVCEPGILSQVFRWRSKLKVYLSPFIFGMRYTSFGRHFTKVERLQEIVDMLHWYLQSGDMVVDFCCGANDFSWLLKKKLEETGKKCFFKNFDLIQPKNDFSFETRDWMTVRPEELPKKGSQLIMGLNPPFGVQAALANKFVDHALKFQPKLVILIVPPETERLDKKVPPYDLIWEDEKFLSGKSFYLPGSVDENDRQMEQWNNTAPLLYLWSRQDMTEKHRAIAQKHNHLFKQPLGSRT